MAMGAGRSRAPVFDTEGVAVVPPIVVALISIVGMILNENGTRPEGPHIDVDALAP